MSEMRAEIRRLCDGKIFFCQETASSTILLRVRGGDGARIIVKPIPFLKEFVGHNKKGVTLIERIKKIHGPKDEIESVEEIREVETLETPGSQEESSTEPQEDGELSKGLGPVDEGSVEKIRTEYDEGVDEELVEEAEENKDE